MYKRQTEGDAVLRGAPGSGKTTLLLAAVTELVHNDHSFLVLTPDRSRADQLMPAVQALAPNAVRPVRTPIGWAYSIVSQWRNTRDQPLGDVEPVSYTHLDVYKRQVWGLIWAFALCIIGFFVHGTVQEIRNQAVEGFARSYVALYFFSLFVPAVIAFCRTGGVEASKWLYLTVQLLNFTVLLGVFRGVLRLAGGNGFAFFLGNPEPGVVSLYEAFFIWFLFLVGAALQMLSVMNDKYRNEIRIGVGGILFIISIFLPNMLSSFALLRACLLYTSTTPSSSMTPTRFWPFPNLCAF